MTKTEQADIFLQSQTMIYELEKHMAKTVGLCKIW